MTVLKNAVWLCSVATSGLLAATPVAHAETQQTSSRQGKKEIYLIAQPMSGDTTSFEQATLEIDDTNFFGLGIGYNLDKLGLNFNAELVLGSPDSTTKYPSLEVTNPIDISGVSLNADYNFLNTQLTPVVTGGIGWFNFSGEVAGNADFAFEETDFSYTIGGGVRWDITKNLFVKGLYKATWTKLKDTDENLQFNGISLNLGYMY